MILACDVGGTKSNVALLEEDGARLTVVRLVSYPSREHASLLGIITAFLGAARPKLHAAGFGIAGPVIGHRVETTNLPWTVNGLALARALGLERVSLLNDLEVQAWALPELDASEQMVVQAGVSGPGNLAVIAAGTGLGMAALLRGGGPVRSLASELLAGFRNTGRLSPQLDAIPLHMITTVRASLIGAARFALTEAVRGRWCHPH